MERIFSLLFVILFDIRVVGGLLEVSYVRVCVSSVSLLLSLYLGVIDWKVTSALADCSFCFFLLCMNWCVGLHNHTFHFSEQSTHCSVVAAAFFPPSFLRVSPFGKLCARTSLWTFSLLLFCVHNDALLNFECILCVDKNFDPKFASLV